MKGFIAALALVIALAGTTMADGSSAASASDFDCATVTDVPLSECQALVELFHGTTGDGWKDSTGWLSNPTVCDWYGITCTAGHVTVLQLGANQLSGSIPAELGDVTSLQFLWLQGNDLSGTIPPTLGDLVNLRWLALNQNQLSGSIPSELGNLVSLANGLDLGTNQLSGSIPPELGNLVQLGGLSLRDNQLSGGIPSELGKMVQLSSLDLSHNELSGSIPGDLGELGNLSILNLSSNRLSGNIPPELGNLGNLYELNLSDNGFSGSIPPQLANLISLSALILSHNRLAGGIPLAFTGFSVLWWFDFSDTDLCEPIDAEFQGWLKRFPEEQSTGVLCVPVADPGGPYMIKEGHSLVLYGSGSADPDGLLVQYEWDLDGDGITDVEGVTVPFDAGDGPSIHTVCLTVTDEHGETDTNCTIVEVLNVNPTVGATPETQTIVIGSAAVFEVPFADPSPDDSPFLVSWDFGDGTGADPMVPVQVYEHEYTNSGKFIANVTVTDKDGGVGTDSLIVIVLTPSEATEHLLDHIRSLGLPTGTEKSLSGSLRNVQKILGDDVPANDAAACGKIKAFRNEVEALLEGRKLDNRTADALRKRAVAIAKALDC